MRLYLLILFVLLYFTASYMLAPTIDVMWREGLIPGDEATWRVYGGLLRTLPAIIGIILTIPVAVIADRYGIKRTVLVLGLTMSIGLLMVMVSVNYAILMLAFTVFGVGMSCIWAPLMSLIAEILPAEKRGVGYAMYYASTILGFIAALIVGVILYWRTAFTSIGVLLFLMTIILYTQIPGRKQVGGSEERSHEFSLRNIGKAITPAVIAMLVLVLVWGIPWGTITTYSVDYLVTAWGIKKESASIILIVSAISIILGHMAGGMLSDRGVKRGDRLARIKISILGVAVGTLVMLVFVLYPYPHGSQETTHLLPPLLLAGFGMLFTTLSYPNINVVISEIARPEYKTTVFSLVSVLNTIGWNTGPTIYGGLVALYSSYLASETSSILALKYAISTIVLLWIIPLFIWISMLKLYPREAKSG